MQSSGMGSKNAFPVDLVSHPILPLVFHDFAQKIH
ncbi:hypothetical protein PCC9214_04800 [Planktothrix tepida]|uniref:Uncharacterized protein n=1 Tax=Planktothrix pseudagardhii TaxID=132604 RepID=A0A9W4G3F8_9CYAN|nr:hypothetical protein NO713_00653 [Planktothrix pseudagardhii]CAD5981422.1 hypothetical protein PCC9214_04800 [Planktothrix tepida]